MSDCTQKFAEFTLLLLTTNVCPPDAILIWRLKDKYFQDLYKVPYNVNIQGVN